MAMMHILVAVAAAALMMVVVNVKAAGDTNSVFSPCTDTKVEKGDGFTFGLAFSAKDTLFFNQTLLSPCDKRLQLHTNNAKLAVFRPKVDEISLLTLNSTTTHTTGGYMVAFAGRQYAARSQPAFVSDSTHVVKGFTLVLEFRKGTLQNLLWKNFGCGTCNGDSVVCINNTICAIPTSKCKYSGGRVDCSPGIQVAFSGTDKNDNVLTTWYEVAKIRQYSLFALYSDFRDSVMEPFSNLI